MEGLQGAEGSQTRHSAVLPAGSSPAGLLSVGSSWFTPPPDIKMSQETELSCSVGTFTAGCHPSEQANHYRVRDPQPPNALTTAMYFEGREEWRFPSVSI